MLFILPRNKGRDVWKWLVEYQSILFNKWSFFPTLNKIQSTYPELTFKSQIQLWLNNEKPSLWTKAGKFLVRILWHGYIEDQMDLVKAGLLTQSPKINLVENWSQVALQSQRAFLTRQTASPSIPSTEINSQVFPRHRLGKY